MRLFSGCGLYAFALSAVALRGGTWRVGDLEPAGTMSERLGKYQGVKFGASF